jgi:hypothetical protein
MRKKQLHQYAEDETTLQVFRETGELAAAIL